jgi:hypothetical protein
MLCGNDHIQEQITVKHIPFGHRYAGGMYTNVYLQPKKSLWTSITTIPFPLLGATWPRNALHIFHITRVRWSSCRSPLQNLQGHHPWQFVDRGLSSSSPELLRETVLVSVGADGEGFKSRNTVTTVTAATQNESCFLLCKILYNNTVGEYRRFCDINKLSDNQDHDQTIRKCTLSLLYW